MVAARGQDNTPALRADPGPRRVGHKSLSRSAEDYLKAIHRLSGPERAATTTAVAGRLRHSPAAVTAMVKRLARTGHVTYTRYRGVRLTPAGRRAALAVVRRHRVIELYLAEKLDYDWASVHEEAERLEHVASDELVERMARALGEPDVDPHGAPIPSREGALRTVVGRPLDQIESGRQVTIREVDDDDSARLRYLEKLGLMPAAILYIAHRAPFGGPITVRVGGKRGTRRVIGQELASCVIVASR
jgi:DtxR family Mn-dependent transcriptional regulator